MKAFHVRDAHCRVYNASTGRLCKGFEVVYTVPEDAVQQPMNPLRHVTRLVPGTWSKPVAKHIARLMNDPAYFHGKATK